MNRAFTERREKYHTGNLLEDIVRFVDDYDNVTMAELSRDWPEHFHDGTLTTSVSNPNNIIWVGMTKEGCAVLEWFIKEKRVEPCEWMAYMIDGEMLRLPMVKSKRSYKKPHWLPVKLMSRTKPLRKPPR